jgi:phage terminase Nu1 subunit (DNA packaging protein)
MDAVVSTVLSFPQRRQDGEVWEPWLDEKAIARHFGASTRTVRRWMRDGMPSRLIGGLRRYRLSQCEDWHEQRRDTTCA